MTLAPRETAILWSTVAAILATAGWIFGAGPVWDQWSANQQLLETAQVQYDDNRRILDDAPKTEALYETIKATIPRESSDERSAQRAFSEDVDAIATKILGGRPQLGTVESQPLKEVKGFNIMSLSMNTQGNLDSVSRLLKSYTQKGYLLTKVTISQRNLDLPELRLDITVSRIVQIDEGDTGGGPRRRTPRRLGGGAA